MSNRIKLIVVTSERIRLIPSEYFRDLINSLDVYGNQIPGVQVIVADTTILEDSIKKHKPDGVFFTRGYGTSKEAINLCKSYGSKILYQLDDLHGDAIYIKKMKKVFDYCDFIFATCYEHITTGPFKEYKEKICDFPFHAPDMASKFLNDKSIIKNNKILISGRVSRHYVLRRTLVEQIKKDKLLNNYSTILSHPGYAKGGKSLSHKIVSSNYYDLVSKSIASVVTSAEKPLNYPVFKYFETPACGTLMIAENIPSLAGLGFFPGEHFVSINSKNIKSVFKFVLNKRNDYKIYNIKNNALNLIRDKHSSKNRVEQVIKVLTENKVFHWNDS